VVISRDSVKTMQIKILVLGTFVLVKGYKSEHLYVVDVLISKSLKRAGISTVALLYVR